MARAAQGIHADVEELAEGLATDLERLKLPIAPIQVTMLADVQLNARNTSAGAWSCWSLPNVVDKCFRLKAGHTARVQVERLCTSEVGRPPARTIFW